MAFCIFNMLNFLISVDFFAGMCYNIRVSGVRAHFCASRRSPYHRMQKKKGSLRYGKGKP